MIDTNLKGVLYGIAAALPVFREQGSGHVVNLASTAAFTVLLTMSVYAGTKMAVRAIPRGCGRKPTTGCASPSSHLA